MTVNDGYGNANITFNHLGAKPSVDGSCARIEANVNGSTTGFLQFGVGDDVEAGETADVANQLKILSDEVQLLKNTTITGDLTIKDNDEQIHLANSSGTVLADIDVDTSNGLQLSTKADYRIRLRPNDSDAFVVRSSYNDSVKPLRTSNLNSRNNNSSITISGGADNGNGAHILLHGASNTSHTSKAFYDAEVHTFRVQDGSPEVMVIEDDKVRLPNTAIGDINENQEVTTKAYVDNKVSTAISGLSNPTFSYDSSSKTLTITT